MIADMRLAFTRPTWRAVKGALAALTPPLAWATEQQILRGSPLEEISLLSWVAMLVFILLGWIIADIDKVAELWNVEGVTPRERILVRLKLLQSVIASIVAGVFAYFLGKISPEFVLKAMGVKFEAGQTPETHEFLLLILATGAAWQGARWFEKIFGAR